MSKHTDALDQQIKRLEKERALLRRATADKSRDEQVLSNLRGRASAERQRKYNVGGRG